MHVTLFLGAGFSAPAGLPFGNALFAEPPYPHSDKAARDVDAVLNAYDAWRFEHRDARAEEFVTAIFDAYTTLRFGGGGTLWPSLVRFLGYQLATPFASFYEHDSRTSRSRDNIFEAALPAVHQEWWGVVLEALGAIAQITVITTNWDILVERALRPAPTTRKPRRPGFHYGFGPERLKATTAYPRSHWRDNPIVSGSVPLLKLHGSLNWAVEHGTLVKYGDLRPAFRGDAAIVPPTHFKAEPTWASHLWQHARDALMTSDRIIVVGYSFPHYDADVWRLFSTVGANTQARPVHIFDPQAEAICLRMRTLLPSTVIMPHAGLPEGMGDLVAVLS